MILKTRDTQLVVKGDNNENAHIVITGRSGSGKTMMLQYLAMNAIEDNCHVKTVLILDTSGSFDDDQLSMEFVKALEMSGHIIKGVDGVPLDLEAFGDKAERFLTKVIGGRVRMGEVQSEALRGGLGWIMADGSFNRDGIIALRNAMETDGTGPAMRALDKIRDIVDDNVFISGKDLICEGKLNLIRFSGMNRCEQILASEITLAYVWEKAQLGAYKSNPLMVFVDEAHAYTSGAGAILAELFSEGRKFGINLVMATQTVSDFKGKRLGYRLEQAATRFFFRPSENEVQQFANCIDNTHCGNWSRIIRSLSVGESVMVGTKSVNGEKVSKPLVTKLCLNKDLTESVGSWRGRVVVPDGIKIANKESEKGESTQ